MSEHTINQLAALSGLSVRTIRYYLAQGLIAPAGREGPGTRYPDATLARLRLITRLRDAHLPLAEIRKRLAALSDDEIAALGGPSGQPTPPDSALDYVRSLLGPPMATELPSDHPRRFAGETTTPMPRRSLRVAEPPGLSESTHPAALSPAATEPNPAQPARSQWERVAITPDIEIHLRRPLSRRDNRLVERLIAFARQLQGEDNP